MHSHNPTSQTGASALCTRSRQLKIHSFIQLVTSTKDSFIHSTGLITIGILYSSLMSQGMVLTFLIDVLKCGEVVVNDFKMATSPNITAMG